MTKTEQAWLQQARTLLLRGDLAGSEAAVALALREHPGSFELRCILAGVYGLSSRAAEAETALRQLLVERSDDAGTAFALARLLIDQGRSAAAGACMRAYFEHAKPDPELAIRAIEMLSDCSREHDAAVIARLATASAPDDPRLHAYAGTLEAQLGEFERARTHYAYALEHAPAACEWHVPYGMASIQRYSDAQHHDFERFRECLRRNDLSDKARSTMLFALAKAHDDIGDFGQAAMYSRQANALAHAFTQWSRKPWRRAIEARLHAKPRACGLEPQADFTLVLVVGMPRSGTTLVTELLARHPRVCNRGETHWLATLAQQANLIGGADHSALRHAAVNYAQQLRQDDAHGMRWFIDKQPLNFRYVDLALALFPGARIIYCRRDARDNALSLWMQSFLEAVQGYAYDFSDIAMVMHDCERLMSHWQARFADSIRTVSYEHLVAAPQQVIAGLTSWLDLAADVRATGGGAGIRTASVWQARQPVYASSVGRWEHYACHLPELARFTPGGPAPGDTQRPASGNNR